MDYWGDLRWKTDEAYQMSTTAIVLVYGCLVNWPLRKKTMETKGYHSSNPGVRNHAIQMTLQQR
eukprot:scaffold168418_cov136-Cyclotella_meneghiniana.AAC.1